MADHVELEARISAMELVLLTHILQSGVESAAFDPRAFAAARRDAWAAVGKAICDGCPTAAEEEKFARAYAAALERMGHLLVELAAPVQEAIDEVNAMGSAPPGSSSRT